MHSKGQSLAVTSIINGANCSVKVAPDVWESATPLVPWTSAFAVPRPFLAAIVQVRNGLSPNHSLVNYRQTLPIAPILWRHVPRPFCHGRHPCTMNRHLRS